MGEGAEVDFGVCFAEDEGDEGKEEGAAEPDEADVGCGEGPVVNVGAPGLGVGVEALHGCWGGGKEELGVGEGTAAAEMTGAPLEEKDEEGDDERTEHCGEGEEDPCEVVVEDRRRKDVVHWD